MAERNLVKRQQALLHAADDVIEATVAGEWLREIENPYRLRVLLTGMVVAYARPYTRSDFTLEENYEPGAESSELHELLLWWRDKVYAHTDRESGRKGSIWTEPGGGAIEFFRHDFPRQRLDEALALFGAQRQRFERAAGSIQRVLNTDPSPP